MLTLGIWKSIQPIVSENKSDTYFQSIITYYLIQFYCIPRQNCKYLVCWNYISLETLLMEHLGSFICYNNSESCFLESQT